MKSNHISPASLLAWVFFGLSLTLGSCSKSIKVEGTGTPAPTPDAKPAVEVYVENSGSMKGYFCEGSHLKDAVYYYVSQLREEVDTTRLFYINRNVHPFPRNLKDYIYVDGNGLISNCANKADTQISDLGRMLSYVIGRANDSTISLFVSDCLLDVPAEDPKNYLTQLQITLQNALLEARKQQPELALVVMRMTSKFTGVYYYLGKSAQGVRADRLDGVERPYYVWLLGNRAQLAQLFSRVSPEALKAYGMTHYAAFVPQVQLAYSVTNKASTGPVVQPGRDGEFTFLVRADLSSTLLPADYLLDASHYTFSTPGPQVADVKPMSKKGPSGETHVLTITIPQGVTIAQSRLQLFAPTGLPAWVEAVDDDTDADVHANVDKTTGIAHQLQGVVDAYAADKPLAEMPFAVKH